MEYRLFIVEDNEQIRKMIRDYFTNGKSERFVINEASNGLEANNMLQFEEYDLVLLDIMMPYMDGFALCKLIRKNSDVPIVFLTAKTMERDVLTGYDLGCDDYVTKPFSLATLYAKCIALLNRSKGTVVSKTICVGAISLNPENGEVFVNRKQIKLAPKELELLNYLMNHKDKTISREILLNAVWGDEYEGYDRTVDNHIKNLRKKLGEASKQIITVFSRGYKMTE
jgi:DNA-binding response OmpR family regulator